MGRSEANGLEECRKLQSSTVYVLVLPLYNHIPIAMNNMKFTGLLYLFILYIRLMKKNLYCARNIADKYMTWRSPRSQHYSKQVRLILLF